MCKLRFIALLLVVLFHASQSGGQDFLAGADFSHLSFFENHGVVYQKDGQSDDPLEMLHHSGVNCVRLRLFTSNSTQAAADPYNSINNLDYTLALAHRVKKAGLKWLLDFHYSDTWADPAHQAKPTDWNSLDFARLEQEVYDYSSNCIAQADDVLPAYAQIGNEITSGILWPDGRVGGDYETAAQWSKFGRLLKAAARGIRSAAGTNTPKIVIHIDRGGDWSTTQWFFDRLREQQVEFDIIGLSYYPFWHGSLAALQNCLTNAAQRYGKPVVVMETAFPWNTNAWDGTPLSPIVGIRPGVDGQVQYVAELAQIVKTVPGRKGIGIFWWGAEYQRLPGFELAGFDTRSFFDSRGELLPVVSALGQLDAPVRLTVDVTDSSAVLHWPLSGAGMTLVCSTNLSSSLPWLPVSSSIRFSEMNFVTSIPFHSTGPMYYRLRYN